MDAKNWHQPTYKDRAVAEMVARAVRALGPLVTPHEVEHLAAELSAVSENGRFVLHIGDCAERFDQATREDVRARVSLWREASALWSDETGESPVVIGRAAGQYAKPRSAAVEVRDGAALPSYLGDVVNGEAFDAAVREPDPSRMLVARSCAEKTLSFIRQETFGEERRYFVSHEALLLEYEQQFLHDVGDQRYHLGTHMVWIGERTRSLKSPHVAMLAAVANPLGLKVGPETNPVELTAIVQKVTAHRRNRPILLITRLGAGAVRAKLPALVDAMAHEQRKTLWICDPMHGNTFTARSGRKTRSFDAVLQEINETVSLHAALGSNLDGLSLESAATMVTECVGGPDQLTEGDLSAGYETACDPRLNPRQLTALLRSVAACRRVLLPQAACGNPYRDCAADQDRCLGMTFASEPPVLVSQLSKRPQLSKGHST